NAPAPAELPAAQCGGGQRHYGFSAEECPGKLPLRPALQDAVAEPKGPLLQRPDRNNKSPPHSETHPGLFPPDLRQDPEGEPGIPFRSHVPGSCSDPFKTLVRALSAELGKHPFHSHFEAAAASICFQGET